LLANSDDFVFDNQVIAQAVVFDFRFGEISCPTKYFKEASSISFRRSVRYGLGVLATTGRFALHKTKIKNSRLFQVDGRKLAGQYYSATARENSVPGKTLAKASVGN